MSEIIRKYYTGLKKSIMPQVLDNRINKFERNPDICGEFEYWIENKTYKEDGLVINGYSAKLIASMSEFAGGETAFLTLIELRENPERAKRRIKEGFKKK